jgi:asparagine synthase (glutamine-hydrolysing)
MCGIAGIFVREGQAPEKDLQQMAEALSHRGPDDRGFYLTDHIGLAQTRLSIIDLAHGHQPLIDPATGAALVANGEIYNYVELRPELEGQGCRFATGSDCENILHGYAVHGLGVLARLHGMFAFALYDPRRQEVVLARDRLGIKPLYYAELPDRVLFASEIKALLAVWPREPEVDAPALLQYLQNQFNTGEQTIVRGIRRVSPGEVIVVDRDLRLRRERYWSPLDVRPRELTFEEAAEEFDPLFATVLREHLRADVPYGLFLSGGVDSGVLLAMMTRLQGDQVRTFSVGYPGATMADEQGDATALAARFGARHTPIGLEAGRAFRRLPHVVWATDDLLRDYACLPTSFLAQRASQELKVVLSGEGGDEAFAGYSRYRPGRIENAVKRLLAPGSGGFRTHGHWRWPWPRRLFGPQLRSVAAARRAPFVGAWASTPRHWSDLQRRQYTDLATNLPDDLLVKADRILMSFGLEGRVPFLDHRIVEFGLALPDGLKVSAEGGKLFLKRWAEHYLPSEYLWRKKTGFRVPIGEWLRGDFLAALSARLPSNPAIRRWFRPAGVKRLLEAQAARGGASREVFGLLQFAIWHRLFIESPGLAPSQDEDPLDWLD